MNQIQNSIMNNAIAFFSGEPSKELNKKIDRLTKKIEFEIKVHQDFRDSVVAFKEKLSSKNGK